MIICQICQTEHEDIKNLGYHLRSHGMKSTKSYYDKYMKKDTDGFCEYCKEPTECVGLRGYKVHCSRSCAAKSMRNNLRNDPARFHTFIEKVKCNVSNHWKTDAALQIRTKISNTIKYKNSLLTEEELKEKYGWLNKLSPEERSARSKEMVEKSILKWWKEASEEEKQKLIEKRGNSLRRYDYSDITSWENYRRLVRLETEKTYKKFKSYINPLNIKRSKSVHLDHIYSVIQGFVDDVPIDIICSPLNLQIVTSYENLTKQSKCNITLDELLEKYEESLSSSTIFQTT